MSRKPKEKPGIMLYFSNMFPAMESLTDEQLGLLVRAIFSYGSTGELLDLEDGYVKIFFMIFKPIIDRDAERYEEIRANNRAKSNRYWDGVRAEKDNAQEPTESHGNLRDTTGTRKTQYQYQNQYQNQFQSQSQYQQGAPDQPDELAMKAVAARKERKNQEMQAEDQKAEAIQAYQDYLERGNRL